MNKIIKRGLCLSLAFVLSFGTCFANTLNYEKEETVYVLADENGKVNTELISVWVHSNNGKINVNDKTDFTSVKNIKGSEKIKLENNNISYNIENSDIYYRGSSKKNLPFEINLTYYLDGVKIAPKDLVGKSGKVKILINTKNNIKKNVSVNGTDRTIYLPMLVAGTINFPNDRFKNLKYNNGKLVNDAKNQVLSFVTMPGMKDSFNFTSSKFIEKFDKFNKDIVIEADVNKFKLDSPMFVVTTDIPEFDEKYNVKDVIDSVDELKGKGKDLLFGLGKLKSGQALFGSKLKSYTGAVDKLNGAGQMLSKGSDKLKENGTLLVSASNKLTASSKLFIDGISNFNNASSKLVKGMNIYSGGANKIYTGLNAYMKGLTGVVNKTSEFAKGASTITTSLNKIKGGLSNANKGFTKLSIELNKTINQNKTDLNKQIGVYNVMIKNIDNSLGQVKNIMSKSKDKSAYLGIIKNLEIEKATLNKMKASSINKLNSLNSNSSNASVKKLLTAYNAIDTNLGLVVKGTSSISENSKKLNDACLVLDAKGKELKAGIDKLGGLKNQLNGGINKLNAGAAELQNKTKPYIAGMNEFNLKLKTFNTAGVSEFSKNLKLYTSKVNTLSLNNGKLLDGQNVLTNGSNKIFNELSNAMSSSKLEKVDNIISDLDTMAVIKDKLEEFSNENMYFAQNMKDAKQKLKFVVKIKAIK
ncbi:MAG: hypothetical protein CSB15_00165 [Clostridiales bacterium]|nr:MAG: hypothetical protein CSB15_00165 [Clostridiales bacterium]